MPRILCALGAATSPELAPELTITSRKRKEIPFFDIAREGQRDKTKSLRCLLIKRDVLATYSDKARTGHNSSSGKPAAKSDRLDGKSAWERTHRSLSFSQKLRNI